MPPRIASAADLSAQIWAREMATATSPAALGRVADQLASRLRRELGRWIGAEGYSALMARALSIAVEAHPALVGITGLGADAAVISEAAATHGNKPVAAGLTALLTALIDLLGRLVGPEMAMQLIRQADEQRTGSDAPSRTRTGQDG